NQWNQWNRWFPPAGWPELLRFLLVIAARWAAPRAFQAWPVLQVPQVLLRPQVPGLVQFPALAQLLARVQELGYQSLGDQRVSPGRLRRDLGFRQDVFRSRRCIPVSLHPRLGRPPNHHYRYL